jgi:hypothetical protein
MVSPSIHAFDEDMPQVFTAAEVEVEIKFVEDDT